ncbi:MAG: hypothetical protein ACE15D_19005 [Candidatus Eisenbacteria bacterium]
MAGPIRMDPAMELEVNVVVRTPHVVNYRIWTRVPEDEWQVVADGESRDSAPDHQSLGALSRGTEIAYWFAVGGNPHTRYVALLLLSQGGKLLIGGDLLHQGKVSGKGAAEVTGSVELI